MRHFRTLGIFDSPSGRVPRGRCLTMLLAARAACAVAMLYAATATVSLGQTFTRLASFTGNDGSGPSGLIQGADGNFYGTTPGGSGTYNGGTVFEVTPAGELLTLHTFCQRRDCTDGSIPYGGLVLGASGNFYGTTYFGGATKHGTIFEISPEGALTTLYSFCSENNCADGEYPTAGLIQGTDGNFYGTTGGGGVSGGGTVFEITPAGVLTTLYSFCSQTNCADGSEPLAGLIQAANGNFYGTTAFGGTPISDKCFVSCTCFGGCGTVFEITAAGALTTLYSFCSRVVCFDGSAPYAGLVQSTNGNLYGTTYDGGATTGGSVCGEGQGCGTAFEITPEGTLTTLHDFCAEPDCADGTHPEAGLVEGTDGNLYGTTYSGGVIDLFGDGTVFEITPAGKLTTLHDFARGDGSNPAAAPIQSTNGSFYGTTVLGGASYHIIHDCYFGCGTVFGLSVGLGPFVETKPTLGGVGTRVTILGKDLTGTTSVTFNGTTATFTVDSDTEITATVPGDATSGKVQVTTPARTLTSNVRFTVKP